MVVFSVCFKICDYFVDILKYLFMLVEVISIKGYYFYKLDLLLRIKFMMIDVVVVIGFMYFSIIFFEMLYIIFGIVWIVLIGFIVFYELIMVIVNCIVG